VITSFRDLQFTYQKRGLASSQPLFAQLSLELPAGAICGLLGKNGAGKTTLLKLMSGLLFPDAGDSLVLGHRPQGRNPGMLEQLYLLPEEFDLPAVTPGLYRRLHAPLYPSFDPRSFDRYLSQFAVDTTQKLSSMSYGQKKKFLIAFGLATGARLLLLDEPTNGLDIPSKRQFRRMLAEAVDEQRTFLISTHQVRDVQNLIDPIIILEEGRIVFHEDLYTVSDRLALEIVDYEPDSQDDSLYWEKVPGGYTILRPRREEEEPRSIDLELLFNAIVEGKGIRHLFAQGGSRNGSQRDDAFGGSGPGVTPRDAEEETR
jgi:ABC-2 type transport system ATP-binding protein